MDSNKKEMEQIQRGLEAFLEKEIENSRDSRSRRQKGRQMGSAKGSGDGEEIQIIGQFQSRRQPQRDWEEEDPDSEGWLPEEDEELDSEDWEDWGDWEDGTGRWKKEEVLPGRRRTEYEAETTGRRRSGYEEEPPQRRKPEYEGEFSRRRRPEYESASSRRAKPRQENMNVVGDIWSMHSDDLGSQFVDIAVTDYGTYALLDKNKGRVFLYDFDGQILNVFGSMGNLKGEYKSPVSIAWLGDKLVTADKTLKCLYILAPTAFGQAVLDGNESYYFGRWDEALVSFEKAVALNANYEVAYNGIGKNYLMKDDYETAMYYFKLGNNREFYSKAYNGYRGKWLEEHFGIVMALLLLVIGAVVWSEIRYHKSQSRGKKKQKAARGKGEEK